MGQLQLLEIVWCILMILVLEELMMLSLLLVVDDIGREVGEYLLGAGPDPG